MYGICFWPEVARSPQGKLQCPSRSPTKMHTRTSASGWGATGEETILYCSTCYYVKLTSVSWWWGVKWHDPSMRTQPLRSHVGRRPKRHAKVRCSWQTQWLPFIVLYGHGGTSLNKWCTGTSVETKEVVSFWELAFSCCSCEASHLHSIIHQEVAPHSACHDCTPLFSLSSVFSLDSHYHDACTSWFLIMEWITWLEEHNQTGRTELPEQQ